MISKAPPPIWISPNNDLTGLSQKNVEYREKDSTKIPQLKKI